MTRPDGLQIQASRYLHLLHRHDQPVAFNSLTLEMFEIDLLEHAYLGALTERREVAIPTGIDLAPLLEAGLIVDGDEPEMLAIQRLGDGRRKRRSAGRGHFGTLRLALTERCNMACTYCFQQKMYPDSQPVLSEQHLRETLAWFIEQGAGSALTVQYFGGEPMLEWDSIVLGHSILEEARSAGIIPSFRETMTTNGTLMTDERAGWLVEAGIDLTVSFDGPPEWNDQLRILRSGRGTFDGAARGLRKFIAAGGASSILMTATPANVTKLPEFVRWFVEESGLAPTNVGVNSPQPTERGWETGGGQLAESIWQVWRYCQAHGLTFHGPGTFIPFHLKSLSPQTDACVDSAEDGQDPSWPMYVSADGRRSLCLVHHKDHRVEVAPEESTQPAGQRWHTAPDPIQECDRCIASQICGGPCSLERILWQGRLSDDRCGFMRTMTQLVITQG